MKNFKLIACAVIIFSANSLIAQDLEDLEAKFWSQDVQHILNLEYPEDWSDESVIIFRDHRYQQYINSGKNIYITSSKHQILKIQDQSSLEDFSEISLDKDSKVSYLWNTYAKNETLIGIRLIKPDGSIEVIDVEKEEVLQDEKRKIAIPGLEIGDVIDLFIHTYNKEKDYDGYKVYHPIETTIKDYYPIVDYRIAVEVENDFFLNMQSYNGAPAVKEEETDRNATQKYVVEAQNLDKIETKRWYYPLVEEPTIKFQVVFARSSSNEKYSKIFTGEDGERKGIVTKEDVLDYYDRRFAKVKKKRVKKLVEYLEEKNITNVADKFRAALEYIRFDKNTRFFEGSIAHEAEIIGDYPPQQCYDYYFGRYEDIRPVLWDLRALCMEFEVSYDELLVQPRYDGPLEDMLIKANARRGLRINLDKPLYILEYSESMDFDEFPAILESSEVYVGEVEKDREVVNLKVEKLPASTAGDNVYQEDINLQFSDDFKDLNFDRAYKLTGHFKNDYRYDFISWIEFLEEDYNKYDTYKHFYQCGYKKAKKKQEEQFQSLIAERKTQSEEYLLEKVKNEWDAEIENYSDEPINTGRYGVKTPFQFKNVFTIKDKFIKKAGPNYLLEIGKFIGSQVEIGENERDRNANIYLDYAKTYNYNIDLVIPEGYMIKGLDNLNINIDNPTGSFVSVATVENGILKLKTEKKYKKNFLPASEWSQMLPWLDAAREFNNVKIMLQKV